MQPLPAWQLSRRRDPAALGADELGPAGAEVYACQHLGQCVRNVHRARTGGRQGLAGDPAKSKHRDRRLAGHRRVRLATGLDHFSGSGYRNVVLEGLDGIDWNRLTHAYGSAEDVPQMIRSLLSDDATERENALFDAWGNIWHQGTVYEATSVAVPFLLEVVKEARSDRPGLLELLHAIANGGSYLDAHQHLSSRLRSAPDFEERLKRELGWVRASRTAVSAGRATYERLLGDPDREVRTVAARLLSLADYSSCANAALWMRLDKETDPVVKAAIVRAGLELDAEPWREAAAEALEASDIERFAAALGLLSVFSDAPAETWRPVLDVLQFNELEEECTLLLGSSADTLWFVGKALRNQTQPRKMELAAEIRRRQAEDGLASRLADDLLSALALGESAQGS